MALVTEHEREAEEAATERAIMQLTDEVRTQGRSIRATQRAFTIFAALALVIALADLIAIAAKLDGKSSSAPAAAPAAAATRPAALPSRVTVGLREFSVTPSARVAKAGRVTFAVRNGGKITHEFVVLKTDKPAGALLKGARADESGNVGETGDLAPGAAKTFSIKLAPGHYALVCNLPGHYAAGQHTDFTVRA